MTTIHLAYNASGAVAGAERGDVVAIVDIIDMSTSAEAALAAGALAVFGAASNTAHPPVSVNPEVMGFIAGKAALANETELVLIAEPRYGSDAERAKNAAAAIDGIHRSGAATTAIIPNIGSEIDRLADFKDKIVLIVSETGGAAFDAAYNAGAAGVLTATVVRNRSYKGSEPASIGAARVLEEAQRLDCGITVVAASANSWEDVLSAQYITEILIASGCTNPAPKKANSRS
jgi:hypothetical protein